MPIMWALADPKIGEREILEAMLDRNEDLIHQHGQILLISDKGSPPGSSRSSCPRGALTCSGRTARTRRSGPGSRCSRAFAI
jgi:hypothetical protein